MIENDAPEKKPYFSLEKIHSQKFKYKGITGDFFIQGDIDLDLSSLRVTLKIHFESGEICVGKYDLYIASERKSIAKTTSVFEDSPYELEHDIMNVMLLLDEYRDQSILHTNVYEKNNYVEPHIRHDRKLQLLKFLSSPKLLDDIDKQLELAGIICEKNIRLLLYLVASSYRSATPMHLMVQGNPESGQLAWMNNVKECIPDDVILNLTKLSTMSLYYLDHRAINNRLMVIQDVNGLREENLSCLHELQSDKPIYNLRPVRDMKYGGIKTTNIEVKGKFSSIIFSKDTSCYYDLLGNCMVVVPSENDDKTRFIVEYENRKRSGLIDVDIEHASRTFLKDLQYMLKPYDIINPFAHQLRLSAAGNMLQRLNSQFFALVEQMTYLHQYNREVDEKGRLMVVIQDIVEAANIFFDSIFIKVDGLDMNHRRFYAQLQSYVSRNIPSNRFTQQEIRQVFGISKTHIYRYFHHLKLHGYVHIVGGSSNRGYEYAVEQNDHGKKMALLIKKDLFTQIEQLQKQSMEHQTYDVH